MLTRRTLLAASAAGLAAPAVIGSAQAATPKNVVVQAKSIDDIIGAFDPAESYEYSDNEVCGNMYRKLIVPDPADADKLVGDLAEKWEVSKDGLTFTFQIRKGVLFESGKPLTADDAAFSLQRVVKLNKTPGFILTQFGWNADNVEKMISAKGENVLELKLPEAQASTFVLYCLSATVGCVVEKAVVMANQTNGDLGNAWLKSHSAGSGSYRLVDWAATDHIILEANPHAAVKPHIGRTVIRHTGEPAAQLLLVQKGDADIARDLNADQLKTLKGNADFTFAKANQLTSMYLGCNMSVAQFQKPEVLQALKWAIDYDAIATNITPNVWTPCQTFLPKGSPGAIADEPYKKDVAKAKALLAKAGYPDGFSITLDHFSRAPFPDVAQAIQANLADVGIKAQLLAGEGKQVTTKMRARQFQMTLMTWFPDFLDMHSNAQAFNYNADDPDTSKVKLPAGAATSTTRSSPTWWTRRRRSWTPKKKEGSAWRCTPEDAAGPDGTLAVRVRAAERGNRHNAQGRIGHLIGPAARLHALRGHQQSVIPKRLRPVLAALASVPVTLFGLVLVTFLIGRAMPIDPVIAIVGDHAPPDVIARVRTELGLDEPLYVQFGIFLRNMAHGDLGHSVMTSRPVLDDIARFFPATLELATAAIIIAVIIGLPLGVFAASRQGSRFDHTVRVISLTADNPRARCSCSASWHCWCST